MTDSTLIRARFELLWKIKPGKAAGSEPFQPPGASGHDVRLLQASLAFAALVALSPENAAALARESAAVVGHFLEACLSQRLRFGVGRQWSADWLQERAAGS